MGSKNCSHLGFLLHKYSIPTTSFLYRSLDVQGEAQFDNVMFAGLSKLSTCSIIFTRFKKYSQNSIQQNFMDSKNLFIDETKIGSEKISMG
jgi:hypothetical protein